jgi:hypothetical protein
MPLSTYETTSRGRFQGGSGGYIFIGTRNEHSNNNISPGALILAQGGYGVGGGGGGSGGVVVIDSASET